MQTVDENKSITNHPFLPRSQVRSGRRWHGRGRQTSTIHIRCICPHLRWCSLVCLVSSDAVPSRWSRSVRSGVFLPFPPVRGRGTTVRALSAEGRREEPERRRAIGRGGRPSDRRDAMRARHSSEHTTTKDPRLTWPPCASPPGAPAPARRRYSQTLSPFDVDCGLSSRHAFHSGRRCPRPLAQRRLDAVWSRPRTRTLAHTHTPPDSRHPGTHRRRVEARSRTESPLHSAARVHRRRAGQPQPHDHHHHPASRHQTHTRTHTEWTHTRRRRRVRRADRPFGWCRSVDAAEPRSAQQRRAPPGHRRPAAAVPRQLLPGTTRRTTDAPTPHRAATPAPPTIVAVPVSWSAARHNRQQQRRLAAAPPPAAAWVPDGAP